MNLKLCKQKRFLFRSMQRSSVQLYNLLIADEQDYRVNDVGSVVEWLKHRAHDQHGLSSKPTCIIFCCVLGKDTLRHFPLLGGLGKQF